jgi:hypothetical protein
MHCCNGARSGGKRPVSVSTPPVWGARGRGDAGGLLARQRRAAVVAARFQASWAAGTYAWAIELRCGRPHPGGRPVLADLYATEQGMLFSSRIEWLPSDQLNRRPWEAESLLLSLDVAHYPDDEELAHAVESLTGPIFEPPGGPGRRWLMSMRPTYIREVLDLAGADDTRALWTRCRDHPDAAREWTRHELLDRLRRAQ